MKTKLYINNTLVDLTDDVSIPYTKSRMDVFQPEARNADFSKTVTIPGTKSNNILFGHIFEVSQSIQNTSTTTNFFPDYNPNLRAEFTVYVDGLLVASGYAQLLQINTYNVNKIEYEICLFGTVGDLFLSLGSSKLTDLDFSEYSHTWNWTNIFKSWATEIKDSTYGGGTRPYTAGIGYVYPLIYNGEWSSLNEIPVTSFKTAIYAKTIIDKIFAKAGKTYTSDSFFTSDLFKQLIVPYSGNGFVISEADVIANTVNLNTSSSQADITGPLKNASKSGGGSANYTASTGLYNVDKGGYYVVKGTIQATSTDNLPASTEPYQLKFRINTGTGDDYYFYAFTRAGAGGSVYSFQSPPFASDTGTDISITFVEALDEATGTALVSAAYNVRFAYNYSIEIQKALPPLGGTIDCNSLLPPVLCKDFLIGVIKKFNLQIEETDISGQFNIKTRPDYLTTTVHDWSNKLDIGSKVEIHPMGALDANPYYFTDKDGADLLNVQYKKNIGKQYGDYKKYIVNDFITSEKKIETVFVPTAMYNEQGWTSEKVVSYTAHYNDKGELQPNGQELRLLFYKYTDNLLLTTATIVDLNHAVVGTIGDYPYAGHLDDPYASTLDLCWYTPDEIYFTDWTGAAISYTDNNLYKAYYKDFIDELTNKDSKIVRAYFRLTPMDFMNAKFSDLYYFMGQYFRLNKISDYDLASEKLTMCEFIKTTKQVG